MASSLCRSFCFVLTLLWATAPTSAQSAANLKSSVTLSYESLLPGSQSVKPLAIIFYDQQTLKSSLSSWTPPSLDSIKSTTVDPTSSQLLKIIVPSGSSTLTSLATFNSSLSQIIDLHLSPSGDGTIFSASVYASTPVIEVSPSASKSKSRAKQKSEAQNDAQTNAKVQVNLLGPKPGAVPKFASKKPPVVGPDGKEQPNPEEVEKSFFQKYWWVFAIVALFAMVGGGDK